MSSLFSSATLFLIGAPFLVSVIGLSGLQSSPQKMRRLSLAAAGLAFLSALVLAVGVVHQGTVDQIWGIIGNPSSFHFSVGVYVDRLSLLSVLLITSIGFVVQKYSVRYLDGDQRQGRFFTWLSFVLFSVTLFVISRNLLALTLSWFLVSSGVHRLLLHFPERESAQKAAWRKFVISRIGDTALVAALVLTYTVFGTFEFRDIFEIVRTHGAWDPISVLGWSLNPAALVGSLYVIGAMTKSAQFPFHIWLPDTMETPTPVSALMHAGIINAGGFLIVRLSPIVSHASFALHVLFAVGAVTAFFGGLIYLVQTDIKRSLAFSTIGQMGYMMMQCGLGAFSAAVLHVVMHGFYKANAFLSAAGNIDHSPFIPKTGGESKKLPPLSKFPAALISMALLVGSVVLMKVDLAQKPGGFFLAIFLWVASTQFIGTALSVKGSFKSISSLSMLTFLGMCVYWTALDGIGAFLAPVLDPEGLEPMVTELSPVLVTIVGFIFVIAYLLVEVARSQPDQKWARKWYVLCLNHFYIEQIWQKMVSKVLGRSRLMPSFETMAIQKKYRNQQLKSQDKEEILCLPKTLKRQEER